MNVEIADSAPIDIKKGGAAGTASDGRDKHKEGGAKENVLAV